MPHHHQGHGKEPDKTGDPETVRTSGPGVIDAAHRDGQIDTLNTTNADLTKKRGGNILDEIATRVGFANIEWTDQTAGNKTMPKRHKTTPVGPRSSNGDEKVEMLEHKVSELMSVVKSLTAEVTSLKAIIKEKDRKDAKKEELDRIRSKAPKPWAEIAKGGGASSTYGLPGKDTQSLTSIMSKQTTATAEGAKKKSPKSFVKPPALVLKPGKAWENLKAHTDNDDRKAKEIIDKKIFPAKVVGIRPSKKQNVVVEFKDIQTDTASILSQFGEILDTAPWHKVAVDGVVKNGLVRDGKLVNPIKLREEIEYANDIQLACPPTAVRSKSMRSEESRCFSLILALKDESQYSRIRKKGIFLLNQRCDARKWENRPPSANRQKDADNRNTQIVSTATPQAVEKCDQDQAQTQVSEIGSGPAVTEVEMNDQSPDTATNDK